jgi:hypothetical protein
MTEPANLQHNIQAGEKSQLHSATPAQVVLSAWPVCDSCPDENEHVPRPAKGSFVPTTPTCTLGAVPLKRLPKQCSFLLLLATLRNRTPPKVHEPRKLPITYIRNRRAYRARVMMMTVSEVK